MNNSTSDAVIDRETADVVERFERLYASLETAEESPPPAAATAPRSAAPAFAENEFAFPGAREEKADLPLHTQHVDGAVRESPVQAPVPEASAGVDDIEEAFAILRSAETKARGRSSERLADADADAAAEAKKERALDVEGPLALPVKSYRRFAVPALAAMVFLGLATGYVATRYYDSPEATAATGATAAPAPSLKLEYQLPQKRDAVAARTQR